MHINTTTIRTVCVLGGSGFVGRHLVARLAQAGYRVRVLVRSRERAKPLLVLPAVEINESDVCDEAALAGQLAGMDAVINLVGALHDLPRGTLQRVHVELAGTVIAACRRAGVQRLLHMSALNAATDGPSIYLRTKGEAESRVMAAADLAPAIFRPSVIFGPDDQFLNLFARLSALPVLFLGGATARFAPVHVEDVAAAFVNSLARPETAGQRYDLCGPAVYTLQELVTLAAAPRGRRPRVIPLPAGLARCQAALLARLPGRLMSPDNLDSMRVDSVSQQSWAPALGIRPQSLAGYLALGRDGARAHLSGYRSQAGR